ncbi:hypothetical protein [Streptantibioticus ferralitis]|uniref:Uncharacterized protein n=1 Tax=Streptantibioticus ferralitis TaxID=236510 RepID=A0ABT5YTD7_9ACTN|nr:hypothetical protein [Streptantibioticus ferralitis]MDF2254819.1 hypothetical protein [Streptantibioticus ferralitis]
MNVRKGITALAATTTLAGLATLGLTAPAQAAARVAAPQPASVATSCYGGSVALSLPENGYSNTYTTTSRCNDINLRLNTEDGLEVRVCWAKNHTCQNGWTIVSRLTEWSVIASNVTHGTRFYFQTQPLVQTGSSYQGRAAF